MNKKILIFSCLILIFFSISAVSASEELTNETNDYNQYDIEENINLEPPKVSLQTDNLTKIYKNDSQFNVKIIREYDPNQFFIVTPIVGGISYVTFEVNGILYYRQIENNTSKLNINLSPGTYVITTYYGIIKKTNTITVLPSIIENSDLTKFYKNDSQYSVKILNKEGKTVGAGENVTFNINGVFYTRQTNDEGIAKLNINLQPGNYVITAEYEGCMVSNKIIVRPTLMYYPQVSYGSGIISVRVLDGKGEGLANAPISININGVIYEFKTGDNGIFVADGLTIRLPPEDYLYTVSYNGDSISDIWHLHGFMLNHNTTSLILNRI